jgi:hypothetical protein
MMRTPRPRKIGESLVVKVLKDYEKIDASVDAKPQGRTKRRGLIEALIQPFSVPFSLQ